MAKPNAESSGQIDVLVALANREHRAGRFAEAVAAYRKVLTLLPDTAEIYNDLGNVLVDQRQLDEAVSLYQRAVLLKPDLLPAYNNLGNVLREQGKLDEAREKFEQAIALNPAYAEAHNNLGMVLRLQGKPDQAIVQFRRAVAANPGLVQAHGNLADLLRGQGDFDQAQASLEQIVTLRPDSAEAHCTLANLLKERGKLDRAKAGYRRALSLSPNYVDARFGLGNILMDERKLSQAAAHYERILILQPNHVAARNNLGTILSRQGRLDESLAQLDQAIALDPRHAEAHNNLGNVLKEQGKFDAAAAHYEQALAANPDLVEAHYNRTDLKVFGRHDTDLSALEALAADSDRLPPAKRLFIHFALGKALDDVGDHERAFQHLLLGNALKRREIDYDEAAHQRGFQRAIELFDHTLLNQFSEAGDPSSIPIFVIGMPRSGSTLVEQILASHPQVDAGGELKNLNRAVRGAADGSAQAVPIPACVSTPNAEGLRRLGQAYVASLPALSEAKTRMTDKTPRNFLHVGLIRLILPNARIIHTTRDPVDTCLSCFSKCFPRSQPFSYDLGELGRYYRWYYQLMAHWRSILPAGAMLEVNYEEVVDDLEGQARRLFDYCGLPWDSSCLSFHETQRPIATASQVQVRRPLYRTSVARWRRYEAYLKPLLAELESLCAIRQEKH